MDGSPTAPEASGPALVVTDPVLCGALALYPLHAATAETPGAPAYLTGPEAERLGVLRVAEKPGGATVPELLVHNTGALPLLLLEGETLVGAKQNRTLDASVLVDAGTTTTIPVTCVEAGRWGAPRASARSPRHAPADLRRVKTATIAHPDRRRRKQSAVWDRVSRYQHELATSSPTSALEDVAEAWSAEVAALVAGCRPRPDQCGVAVAIDGTLRGLDCFDKPATLAAYWDGLVAGYALDALRAVGGPAPARGAVAALVTRAERATRTPVPTAGLGNGATLVGDGVVGTELTWLGTHVHISVFVDNTDAPPPAPPAAPGPPAARPTRRSPPRSD
ncbi:MAG: ARPP-1 family domain-containing protein [Actinomycetota bacterium]